MLGETVEEIVPTVKACEGVTGDFDKLEKMAKIFSSPTSFAYHVGKDLIVNGKNIFADIEDALNQYQLKNYFKFGKDIGDALAKAIIGNENNEKTIDPKVKEAVEIIGGILQGAIKAEGLDNIENCIKDSEIIIEDTAAAIKYFKKGDKIDVLKGL